MITKENLKIYQFDTIIDYYDYIIESHVNGQFAQVKNLFNAMSPKQKQEFILYLVYDSNYSKSKDLHAYIGEHC